MFASHRYLVSPGIGVSIPMLWGTAVSVQTDRGMQIPGVLAWRPRSESASGTPALRAAQAFASRVLTMPGVRAVALDRSDPEVRITTFIEKRDPDLRSRIYAVEFEVLGMFESLAADFRVRSLEMLGSEIPRHTPPDVYVFTKGA